jgi:hypothetical protein
MHGIICLEVLIVTVIAWVGLWGLVEEALEPIVKKWHRVAAYAILLGTAIFVATFQKTVSVCGLL